MAASFLPLLNQLTIRDKFARQRHFRANWAQLEIVGEVEAALRESRPARIITLKARRLGVSTVSEALLFLWALRPNTNSIVIAHERPAARGLFDMTRLYYETFPFKRDFPTRYYRRDQIAFDRHGSNMFVFTAENVKAVRSYTYHAAHLSELAFWSNPTDLMTGLAQTMAHVPGTLQIIESTANGVGNWFWQAWQDAKAGENEYKPLFFPWWKHYECIPCEAAYCVDGTCDVCLKASSKLKPRDTDEAELVKRWSVDKPHLAWRRWAIGNKLFGSEDFFRQEYPSDDVEAFLSSGVNAFPEPMLRRVYEPLRPAVGYLAGEENGQVKFKPDARGPLRIYRWPSKDRDWGVYFVGADPSFGKPDSDYAAAQVINRRNREQVAVFQGRVDPYTFADELTKLGLFYNTAMMSVEVEGGGIGTIGRLIDTYPRLWRHRLPDRTPETRVAQNIAGWSTTWKRKAWAITKLAEEIESEHLILHDAATFKELLSYTFYGSKAGHDPFEPASDTHDDLAMSLAIAVVCESTEPKMGAYEARMGVRPDGVVLPRMEQMEEPAWQ